MTNPMRKSAPPDNLAARGVTEDDSGISKTLVGLIVIAVAAAIFSFIRIRANRN